MFVENQAGLWVLCVFCELSLLEKKHAILVNHRNRDLGLQLVDRLLCGLRGEEIYARKRTRARLRSQ